MAQGLLVSFLVLLAAFSFIPFGQRLLEKVTFGWLKAGAMPWIGLIAIFLWTFRVFPNPNLRGYLFGALVTAIAAAMTFWAPRNAKVKSFIKNAFFGGLDIWSQDNFKFYNGCIWGAGIALLVPVGGAILNTLGLISAALWIIWQSYKGHAEKKMTESDTRVPDNA